MLEGKLELARMNPKIVAKEIGDFIVENMARLNAGGGVVGLSGGVDSTVTAALAKQAFDNYNATNKKALELVGYILPSNTNNPADAADGIAVAKQLGIRYEVCNIEPLVEAFRSTNPEAFESKVNKGNMMSRIRANVLHTKAATEKKLVLGTGNRDEDFGVGYYTLFGDGAVHLSPIGALPKRLVKEMAVYLGFPAAATRVPTAGLEPGQTDFGDLGYDYDAVELVSEAIIELTNLRASNLAGTTYEDAKSHIKDIASLSQIRDTLAPQIARSGKFASVEDAVADVLYRHYTAAVPKAELISPKIPKITLNY